MNRQLNSAILLLPACKTYGVLSRHNNNGKTGRDQNIIVRRWARGNAPSVHVPGTSLHYTKSNINMLDLDKTPRRALRIPLKKSLFSSESTECSVEESRFLSDKECSFNCPDFTLRVLNFSTIINFGLHRSRRGEQQYFYIVRIAIVDINKQTYYFFNTRFFNNISVDFNYYSCH